MRFVKQNGTFENIKRYLPNLEAWFKLWKTSEEDQRKLYEQVAEAAQEAGDEKYALHFSLALLQHYYTITNNIIIIL